METRFLLCWRAVRLYKVGWQGMYHQQEMNQGVAKPNLGQMGRKLAKIYLPLYERGDHVSFCHYRGDPTLIGSGRWTLCGLTT